MISKKKILNQLKNVFLVRVDGDRKYLFSEGPEKLFYVVDDEPDLEILEIRKMHVWETLVDSLKPVGISYNFEREY